MGVIRKMKRRSKQVLRTQDGFDEADFVSSKFNPKVTINVLHFQISLM